MNFFADRLAVRGQNQSFSAGRKIRVGTKAVSKRAQEAGRSNPQVAAILKKVAEGRVSFREAEKDLGKLGIHNPFYPRNTREFHAHPWDMGVGSAAITNQLLTLYGEMMEGDRTAKLYKFPVVFPEVGGDVASLIQGGLSVQGGGAETVRYWSDYDASGARVCKHLPVVQTHEQAQRRQGKPIRMPERQPVTRGLCDPGTCLEFQSGMCKFNGTVNFYIPGIPGAGVFQLHTGSTQAATEIYLRLTEAIRATNGRLQNYTPDGRPMFWITKVQATRPYFDEDGKQKLSEQWVPVLEMQIEMPKVLWLKESGQMAELAPPTQSHSLTHSTTAAATSSSPAPGAWMQDDTQEPSTFEPPAPSSAGPAVPPPAVSASPQASQPNLNGENAVDAMIEHAITNGYEDDLHKWVEFRYEGDLDAAANVWIQFFQRFGAKTRDYIAFLIFLSERGMAAEMVLKYLKVKFGPLGSGARLLEMRKHVEELCADGATVATQVMEESLEAATS